MIDDRYIIEKFYNKDKDKLISPRLQHMTDEEKSYIENRFSTFNSYIESIYRIIYDIKEVPKCKYCGKYCKFDRRYDNHYTATCCDKACIHKSIIESTKITLDKLGVTNVRQLESTKSKIRKTCLEKYGSETYRNPEKQKQTMLERYGVTAAIYTERGDKAIHNKYVKEKEFATKKLRGTLNSSNIEDKCYDLLVEKYKDVKRNYKSEQYPYACDFYIPSIDLYIECNFHWTHGDHVYNENDSNDKLRLEYMKSKNNTYYDNAINTWTVRDVNKRNTAKANNLNYIEIWTFDEFKAWIKI